jgi:AcrR family transcriptional regulator/DNA-binding MarR family transcriptional regulator
MALVRDPAFLGGEVQRTRLLGVAVDVALEHGLRREFMGRVVARAGVSREVLEGALGSREECFVLVFDAAVDRVAGVVLPAFEQVEGWRERIRGALAALLEYLDYEPGVARLLIVDALAAGPEVLERRREVLDVVGAALDQGRLEVKRGQEPPPLTAEGVLGAVLSVLHARLSEEDGAGSLYELVNPLTSLVVLPYLGPAAAAKELKRSVPPARLVCPKPPRDPLQELGMRATNRTLQVLAAVASQPGRSNREIADGAGITDEGQISRLLARLAGLGLIENSGQGQVKGMPNAWRLTEEGSKVEQALRERVKYPARGSSRSATRRGTTPTLRDPGDPGDGPRDA